MEVQTAQPSGTQTEQTRSFSRSALIRRIIGLARHRWPVTRCLYADSALGLYDPWETHYGEVARNMVEYENYIDPFWGSPWDSGGVA